jgi:hypothetical protein
MIDSYGGAASSIRRLASNQAQPMLGLIQPFPQRADHHAELVSGGCLGPVADKSQFIGAAFCPVPREWARPAGPPDASFARSLELHGSVFSALNLDDPVFRIALVFRFRRKIGHRVYEVARRRAVASALGGTIRIPVARAS